MSPIATPGESLFSQHVTLTQTQHLEIKQQPPPWLFQWPRLTLSPSSLGSTSSPKTAESIKCSPPPKTPSVGSARSSATFPIPVPARYPSVPSARSPIQKHSIPALTLPPQRVVTSDQSLAAAHPRWRAILPAQKSTLCAAGIAPPAPKPPQRLQRWHLDRRSTAWTLLMARLALRLSFVQHQVPLPRPRVPLYFPARLRHLGRAPTAPSPNSPHERAVMNSYTPTPLRALPNNGDLFYQIHGQLGWLPVLSNC